MVEIIVLTGMIGEGKGAQIGEVDGTKRIQKGM